MRSLLIAAAAAASLVGCAATPEPLLKPTASGNAEARFHGRSIDDVRNTLAARCMAAGAHVQTSPHEVICAKALSGAQATLMQLAIGNSYSTTPEAKMSFNLVQSGPDVEAVGRAWVETQMAFGQVRRVPLDGARDRNTLQTLLLGAGGI